MLNLTVYLLVCRDIPCCTEVVRDSGLYAWKWGCLVIKGMGTRFNFITMSRKETWW